MSKGSKQKWPEARGVDCCVCGQSIWIRVRCEYPCRICGGVHFVCDPCLLRWNLGDPKRDDPLKVCAASDEFRIGRSVMGGE